MASKSDLNDAQELVKKNKKACIANLCEIIHKKVTEKMVECRIGLCRL